MRALVLGGADCVWEDFRAFEAAGGWAHVVIAVNDAIPAWHGHLHHAASLHGDKLSQWKRERAGRGLNADFVTWTRPEHEGCTDRTLSGWSSGSSGFFAVGVALELGAESVVLCGVPMQAERAHFFKSEPWSAVWYYLSAWEHQAGRLRGRVFSMSGWTRDLLGGPPWLQKEAA